MDVDRHTPCLSQPIVYTTCKNQAKNAKKERATDHLRALDVACACGNAAADAGRGVQVLKTLCMPCQVQVRCDSAVRCVPVPYSALVDVRAECPRSLGESDRCSVRDLARVLLPALLQLDIVARGPTYSSTVHLGFLIARLSCMIARDSTFVDGPAACALCNTNTG